MKIARISTVMFFFVTQLKKQMNDLTTLGCDITLIAGEDDHSSEIKQIKNCNIKYVDIYRKISPFKDILTIIKLIKIFKSEKFDIVHSTTPKAGLLVAISAFLVRVPIRLHTFTGQPWIVEKGFKKFLLKTCDKLIVILNTKCYVDSQSQKDILVLNNIGKENQFHVIGSGSLSGVDLERFYIDKYSSFDKNQLKKELNIPKDSFVLLFVGRITKDKGIYELLLAFEKLIIDGNDCRLIIVGPLENEEKDKFERFLKDHTHILNYINLVGYSNKPEKYMSISNLFCLPSYREGFGTVIIEAAAMGIPSIGSKIYGLTDAIVDNETGLLIEVKDHFSLYKNIKKLINDKEFYDYLSKNAFIRVKNKFDSDLFSKKVYNEYTNLFKSKQI